jgi:uncharacterized membrane protein
MDRGVQILVGAFKNEATADQAYRRLKRSENDPWLADAAIVVRQGNRVTFKESKDMGFGKGAVAGGAVGLLASMFFPPAIVITTVGGAIIGGLGAKLHDANIPDEKFKRLGEKLEPGTAAIVAMVDEGLVNQATDALKRLGASVTTEGLDAETVDRLKAAAGTTSGTASGTASGTDPGTAGTAGTSSGTV